MHNNFSTDGLDPPRGFGADYRRHQANIGGLLPLQAYSGVDFSTRWYRSQAEYSHRCRPSCSQQLARLVEGWGVEGRVREVWGRVMGIDKP